MADKNSEITIHDLAGRLGLSTTTVWRALNGQDRVSPRTRDRVRRAADRLNYRPSLVARALSSGRTQTLGVVLPSVANPTFADLVRAVEDHAFDRGYNVLLCNTGFDLDRERRQIELLLRRQVEGVIIVPFVHRSSEEDAHLRELQKRGVPLVAMHHRMADLRLPQVVPDNALAGYEATLHLISCGRSRVGFLHAGLSSRMVPMIERHEGFARAVREQGLNLDDCPVVQVGGLDAMLPGQAVSFDVAALRRLFESSRRPDGLFIPSDTLAVRVMRELVRLGLDVPRDVAVVGFDDSPVASLVTPTLTTIRPPLEEIGARAAGLLFDALAGPVEPSVHALACRLIQRQSTLGPDGPHQGSIST